MTMPPTGRPAEPGLTGLPPAGECKKCGRALPVPPHNRGGRPLKYCKVTRWNTATGERCPEGTPPAAPGTRSCAEQAKLTPTVTDAAIETSVAALAATIADAKGSVFEPLLQVLADVQARMTDVEEATAANVTRAEAARAAAEQRAQRAESDAEDANRRAFEAQTAAENHRRLGREAVEKAAHRVELAERQTEAAKASVEAANQRAQAARELASTKDAEAQRDRRALAERDAELKELRETLRLTAEKLATAEGGLDEQKRAERELRKELADGKRAAEALRNQVTEIEAARRTAEATATGLQQQLTQREEHLGDLRDQVQRLAEEKSAAEQKLRAEIGGDIREGLSGSRKAADPLPKDPALRAAELAARISEQGLAPIASEGETADER
ncbi:hypothetical protein AB0I28_32515 [Phytomonospora sp. NPDC050363]|uniref:hypothetical protein n=1 Tax=Phytomonospora sp. NPDC050363 TaxID=3155642 RepID=UPI0033CF49F2